MTIKTAFPPSVAPDARLLVLGSLPGEESLRQGRYYAHPTNAFWWLIGEVIGEPLPSLAYEKRLARLRAHRIGLWDVIATAQRQGSLDQAIREAELRDLAGFVEALPELRAVAFNGQTSARHGRKQLAGEARLTLLDLPSSSAAHAGMARDAKREAWLELREFL
ncbi:DNA-deoxyinosine glycosylase [Sphingomonas sp. BIUV-7]|uniref:DNA-deoxyinosine glycosylase n=1 Tax=Sphingomonas natans TaxID=3063330 RepID=A0ABT8Y5B3_9SPHN|nr:DNA-deoxyinosine glycosylase [Sphingomonas sp. BIUV-7]MDO6413522.1 DNA-deoxyinosine glycosylase [Sphingomonas sp. BIUV-7]